MNTSKKADSEFIDLNDFEPTPATSSSSTAKSPEELFKESLGKMNLPVNMNLSNPILRDWFAKRREEIRPWGSFVKTTNFDVPQSIPRWTKRLYKNVEHFQSNYVFVFIILFVYCLITSPLLLIAMAILGGACYYLSSRNAERKVFLGGREITLAQQYAGVAVLSIPLFLLVGGGAAVFWVIGASFFFIGLHASFYNFDALDIMEDQQSLTGSIVEEV